MALIPQEYLNSVVAIGVVDAAKKQKRWVGTGFIYARFVEQMGDNQKKYMFYLVTNRHVIQNKNQIIVRFSPSGDNPSKDFPVNLYKDAEPIWTGHSDPKIDVAVLQFNLNSVKDQGMDVGFFRSDDHTLTCEQMKETGMAEGDFIYALGYPMGIVNAERQYVIARSGIVARIRDLYDKRSQEFIIDAFVFPGNSGGPVLSKPEAIGLKGTNIPKSPKLIGIVKGYLPYKDVAISQQTKRPRVIFEENTGLTAVVPVNYIEEAIEQDKKRKGEK